MMSDYDNIAPIYNTRRSEHIGVATIAGYIKQLGSQIAVLDLGCGTGRPIAVQLVDKVRRYFGVDVSAQMVEQFQRDVPGADCLLADLATMDLGDESFDLCFSWGSICHLQPDQQRRAFAHIAQHTRAGGMIVFTGGPDEGTCAGSVGTHRVQHYSLGTSGYDQLFAGLGCVAVFRGAVEDGAAWLYVYKKEN